MVKASTRPLPPPYKDELDDLIKTWPLSKIILDHQPSSLVVVVVGAYKGKLMHYLASTLPNARIEGYEPQEWAAQEAHNRLATLTSDNVVHPYGLVAKHTPSDILLPLNEFGTDACSLVAEAHRPGHYGDGTFKDACIALSRPIDLLVMNIEGYEYELLNYMHDCNLLKNINRIAVQFHQHDSISDSDHALALYRLDQSYAHSFVHYLPSWGYWFNG